MLNMKTIRLLLSFASFLIVSICQSQTVTPAVLNASGGTSFFTFYRFDWSFGEAIAINTMTDATNLVVTNGLLQPNTHNPATIDNSSSWASDEIRILPNPTRDLLEIDFFSKQKGKVTMSLFTEDGQLLANKQFDYYGTGLIEHLSFQPFSSGQYFLKIELVPTENSVRKKGTFKVQKIK